MQEKFIKQVTMTGADDNTDPHDLIRLSDKYPFVEWGISLSRTSAGLSRFPTWRWINHFIEIKPPQVSLSGHICGFWLRDMVKGGIDFVDTHDVAKGFDRFQLNFHGQFHGHLLKTVDDFLIALKHLDMGYIGLGREIIFQLDGVNQLLFKYAISQSAHHMGIRATGLHDLSHGAGVLPEVWPSYAGNNHYCGYAGGLTPNNVAAQVEKIKETIRNKDGSIYPIWIDAETGVRTDSQFDIHKVEAFLQAVEPYIRN